MSSDRPNTHAKRTLELLREAEREGIDVDDDELERLEREVDDE